VTYRYTLRLTDFPPGRRQAKFAEHREVFTETAALAALDELARELREVYGPSDPRRAQVGVDMEYLLRSYNACIERRKRLGWRDFHVTHRIGNITMTLAVAKIGEPK
jgi:hypothetical protein